MKQFRLTADHHYYSNDNEEHNSGLNSLKSDIGDMDVRRKLSKRRLTMYRVIIDIGKRVFLFKKSEKRFIIEYWYWSHFKDCLLNDFVLEFHWSRERIS